jgi:hypothetical protein
MLPGLSSKNAIGASGRYCQAAGNLVRMPTCLYADGVVRKAGPGGGTLFDFDLPDGYHSQTHDRSWTGLCRTVTWENEGGFTLDARQTLPGPLLTVHGTQLFLRLGGCVPDSVDADYTGKDHFVIPGRQMALLVVLDQPLQSIHVVSHAHWELRWERPGARFWAIPLLDKERVPDIVVLKALLASPPRTCEESYEVMPGAVRIRQTFPGCHYAPVPPLLALLGTAGRLVGSLTESTTLLDGLCGPYALTVGDTLEYTVQTGWMDAELALSPVSASAADLSPIPDELVYAGDWTWEPESALDRLLGLRTWALLLPALPKSLKAALLPQLLPPTPEALRQSLPVRIEPTTGTSWTMDGALFDHKGDISWDPDWYNGLTLAGLYRAIHCGEETIARPARALADAVKPERDLLLAYYALFHDWSLGTAWTDARGLFFHADCGHHGLEGLACEAKLRRADGDTDSADFLTYLAAKTATCLLALFHLDTWAPRQGWQLKSDYSSTFLRPGEAGAETFGVNTILDADGVATITSATPNPYCLVGYSPEYQALLKAHGPLERLETLARLWEEHHPERYTDWHRFYVGPDDAENARKFTEEKDQEKRVQASVFYHLAPEITLRKLVLEQPATEIEARFQTPLNLAEQLLLRGDAHLIQPIAMGR